MQAEKDGLSVKGFMPYLSLSPSISLLTNLFSDLKRHNGENLLKQKK